MISSDRRLRDFVNRLSMLYSPKLFKKQQQEMTFSPRLECELCVLNLRCQNNMNKNGDCVMIYSCQGVSQIVSLEGLE